AALQKDALERGFQLAVKLRQADRDAKIHERCNAMLRDAARHDAAIVAKVGIDIDGDAVKADPAAHPHADGGDLVLAIPAIHPDADAALALLAANLILRQRFDHPVFEILHKGA